MPQPANNTSPAVSIVIPSWNGVNLLRRFLPSVIASARRYFESSGSPVEIVIVNDGSEDDTSAFLIGEGFEIQSAGSKPGAGPEEGRPARVDLRLIINEANLGFGKTVNRGFAAARHPLVFLLNNDVEVSLDAIAPLVENFSDQSVFAAHCRVFEVEDGAEVGTGKIGSFSRGFIRVHQSYVTGHSLEAADQGSMSENPFYSIFATGGSSMFDRQKFLDLGSFDELLSPIYWEDVDISYRAWKHSFSIVYEPRSVVRHRVSSTMRRVNKRKIWRLKQRNRLIYHWINLHDRRLFISHLFWVALLAVTAPLRLQAGFILALLDAIKMLPAIRRRRREEMLAAKRSDRELFDSFERFSARADIIVYDDPLELERLRSRPRRP
ncbi:MAG TPA: glycosyltransferase [Blastocatellia bacterium]|nr:glycosyltransferase [Blastocatellia bacterium]